MSHRWITDIPKEDKREGVILLGRGPSVDTLDTDKINKQEKYDICTITDAIKLVDNPTFSFNYHDQGLRRIKSYIKNPKYLIVPIKLFQDLEHKKWYTLLSKLDEANIYVFEGRNRKDMAIFEKGYFDIRVNKHLWNRHGSVVGVVNFLCGYMGYKKIRYLGFDGGRSYGREVFSKRKPSKVEGAEIDYEESWKTVQVMLKHYSDVSFERLTEYVIGV